MNLLREVPDYAVTRTPNGVWRRYLYPGGQLYSEFTSHRRVGDWPLVQIVRGRSPETGKVGTSRGIVAVGQKAVGVLAVGQACAGLLAFGQAAVGIVAMGQAAAGMIAVGQVAGGLLAGVGQSATGVFVVGQYALGIFGWAQYGLGPATLHLWHGTSAQH